MRMLKEQHSPDTPHVYSRGLWHSYPIPNPSLRVRLMLNLTRIVLRSPSRAEAPSSGCSSATRTATYLQDSCSYWRTHGAVNALSVANARVRRTASWATHLASMPLPTIV
jgi:hypothetical protein